MLMTWVRNSQKINNSNFASFIKGIPNMITFLRVILSCILNLYIINNFNKIIIPVFLMVLIFLTDFLDGKIARYLGCTSNFGAAFDAFSDLFCISLLYITLVYFDILPLWFLFIILYKFSEFVITSKILKKHSLIMNTKGLFVFDFIGRYTAVFFYIIPISAFISYNYCMNIYYQIIYILIFITITTAISSTYRIINCIRVLKNIVNNNIS